MIRSGAVIRIPRAASTARRAEPRNGSTDEHAGNRRVRADPRDRRDPRLRHPARQSATSGAPRYNIFHIVFGSLGIVLALAGNDVAIRTFNIGFGAIDLYQAVASRRHWWPEKLFRWSKLDDALHVVIGLALVAIGVFF